MQQEQDTEAAVRQIYEESCQDLREESSQDLQERVLQDATFIGNGGQAASAHTPGIESEETRHQALSGVHRRRQLLFTSDWSHRGTHEHVLRFFGREPKGAQFSAPTEINNQGIAPLPN